MNKSFMTIFKKNLTKKNKIMRPYKRSLRICKNKYKNMTTRFSSSTTSKYSSNSNSIHTISISKTSKKISKKKIRLLKQPKKSTKISAKIPALKISKMSSKKYLNKFHYN